MVANCEKDGARETHVSYEKGRAHIRVGSQVEGGSALTDGSEAHTTGESLNQAGLVPGGGKSQGNIDSRNPAGRPRKKSRAQVRHDVHCTDGSAGRREEKSKCVLKATTTVTSFSLPDLQRKVSEIVEQWKRRQAWHRAEKSLTLQAQAILRRLCGGSKEEAGVLYKVIMGKGDHALAGIGLAACFPLLEAKKAIMDHRKPVEERLEKLADGLPGTQFVKETPGLSLFTLAAVVGECPGVNMSGLLDFGTVQRVWKRFGVAVGEDGTRQRKMVGAEAIEQGYNPARRAVLWTISESLMRVKGPYRELYLQYKAKEEEKADLAGMKIVPAEEIKKMKKEERYKYISKGQVDNRAKRKMGKALLKHLWVIWHTDNEDENGHKVHRGNEWV